VLHPGEQGSKRDVAAKNASVRVEPTCCIQENKDRNASGNVRQRMRWPADVLHPGEQGSKPAGAATRCVIAGLADVLHPGEQGSKPGGSRRDPARAMRPTCCIQENKDRN